MFSVRLLPYKGNLKLVFLDTEDTDVYDAYRWNVNLKQNIMSITRQIYKPKNNKIPFHRHIINIPVGDKRIVQHKNGNRFDNRKQNLIIHVDRDAYVQALDAKKLTSPH